MPTAWPRISTARGCSTRSWRSGTPAVEWAQHFDTVSVCFSKGLGAPVGSALAGPRDLIAQARRHRKLFGGGMRQAGIIAAGALYALDHHIERLAEDHENARRLARPSARSRALNFIPKEIDTNIVIFKVHPRLGTAAEFAARLKMQGLLMLAVGPQLIRAVTHLDCKPSPTWTMPPSFSAVAG